MRAMLRGRALLAVMLGAVLSGCASLLPTGDTPTTLYGLQAPAEVPLVADRPGWQLIVEEPLAERALDTDRIAIYSGPHALQYFPQARWTDRAPRLVQDLIVETFENAGLQMSATRQTVGVKANVALISDLRDFEARVTAPAAEGSTVMPTVMIRLSTKLVSLDKRRVIDARTFTARGTAASDSVADVVAAMNVAAATVVSDIVVWAAAASATFAPVAD
jgi:cholesterol transport system auxiliary component